MANLTNSPGVGADSTAVYGLYKEVFEEGIAEGVNNANPLGDLFKREKVDYNGGKGHTFTAHVGRNVSPFFGGEDSAMAAAGNQRHINGNVKVRKMTARIRLTQEAMDDSVSSVAAWRSAKKDEMTRIIDDIAKREEFALSLDGRGILALVNESALNSTTLTVDSPGNIAGVDFGNRFFQVGMFIAAVNPANGQIRTSVRKVVAVATSGLTITTDAGTYTGWANNDYIVQAASSGTTDVLDTSFEHAYQGLASLVDDGTNKTNYFEVQRSLAPMYRSYVVTSAGALSTDAMQRTSDVVYQTLGGEINELIMHPAVAREFIKLTEADRRYQYGPSDANRTNPGTKAFGNGDPLDIGAASVRRVRTAGLAQVYFLDTKRMGAKQYVAEPGRFVDEDGSILVRDGVGDNARHAFEAWWFARKENFVANPAVCARWDVVTGQTLIVVPEL